jgi:hypothetical protein
MQKERRKRSELLGYCMRVFLFRPHFQRVSSICAGSIGAIMFIRNSVSFSGEKILSEKRISISARFSKSNFSSIFFFGSGRESEIALLVLKGGDLRDGVEWRKSL